MMKNISLYYQQGKEFSISRALSLEWLETNGLGGYSSSTVTNCHTRKYHGLLVSNISKSHGKFVLVSKLEDILILDGQEHFLSASQYPNYFQDGSFEFLKEVMCNTHPCFFYQFGNVVLTKEILMLNEEDTVLIKYKILNSKQAAISIRPLLAYRNFHSLAKENPFIEDAVIECNWGRRTNPYRQDMPPLFLQTSCSYEFSQNGVWYKNFEYAEEQNRGFEFQEDLFSPGIFNINNIAKEVFFSCSTREQEEDLKVKWDRELTRRRRLIAKFEGTPLQCRLQQAGQAFVQKDLGDDSLSIVAGFHWFASWGRDSMIALPGVTCNFKHKKIALAVLRKYGEQELDGIIPNFLGVNGEQNAYNTADASLWFAWAVQQYYLNTKDTATIKKYFWRTLKSIFSYYKKGTLNNIKMQPNGLIYAGDKDTNITWMDAMVNNTPVIRRYGLMVEINSLWFNMLCFLKELAVQFNDALKQELEPLTNSFAAEFIKMFWSEELGYLKDFVNEEQQNTAIRPNQIFAVSLPHSPLPKNIAKKIMQVVQEHLLTPYGLRTLSPKDSSYIGNYRGSIELRDKAYHNGTVWPWLLGHFTEGLLKTNTKQEVEKILSPCLSALTEHLHEAGIGTISEVFDGDYPHKPNGCISQAWSVGEVLRLTTIINSKA
jgi:predicted glycogen debranching enzyme